MAGKHLPCLQARARCPRSKRLQEGRHLADPTNADEAPAIQVTSLASVSKAPPLPLRSLAQYEPPEPEKCAASPIFSHLRSLAASSTIDRPAPASDREQSLPRVRWNHNICANDRRSAPLISGGYALCQPYC